MLQGLANEMRRMTKRIAGTLGLKYEYLMRIQCGFLRRNRGLSTVSMKQGSSRNRFLGQAPLRIVAMLCVFVTSLANAQTITSTSGATFTSTAVHSKGGCQTGSLKNYSDGTNPPRDYDWVQCSHIFSWGITVTDTNCHLLTGSYCGGYIIWHPNCQPTRNWSNGTSYNYPNMAMYASTSQSLASNLDGTGLYNQVSVSFTLNIVESGTPPSSFVYDTGITSSCYLQILDTRNKNSLVGTIHVDNETSPVLPANSKDPSNNPKASCQAAGTDANAPGIYPAPNSASKDPVDLSTGNFYDTLNLLKVAAAGTPLNMAMSYSSLNPLAGSIGFGWGHPYQHSLIDLTSSVKITWPDGHASTYNSAGFAGYTNSAADTSDTLVKNANGTYTLTDRRQKTYTFSATGQLLNTKDRFGFVKNLTYLANGNLDKVTDALSGRFLQFTYDAQNRVVSVSSAGAGTVTLAYSAAGDLASVTDALGHTTTFTYDSNHRLLTKTNALGATVVANTYDVATGKVVNQDDGLSTTPPELFIYATDTTTGNPYTTYKNRTGNTIRHNFDASFNLLSTIDPLGNAVVHTYVPGTNLQNAEMDALTGKIQFTYDASGYVLSRTDALGNVARYTYDGSHNISRITDEAGKVTTLTYDANHHLLTQTDPAGKITTYTYNAQGLPATFTTPNGGVTRFTYDVKGQLATLTDPVGLVTSFTYDAAGRVLTTTDGAGKVWTKTYDLMGHVLTAVDPLGNTTRYTYDALGRVATKTAPGGGITQYAYDIHDNLVSITNPMGGVTTFAYDANDQLISTTDALGRVTTLTRDAKGRVTSTTNALGNVNTLGYDAVDNVITTKDALNNVTTLTYDQLYRLTSITDPLNNHNAASFDAVSRVVNNTDGKAGVTSFAYDALSRLISTTDARGGVAAQTFDANGNRLSFTDTRGNKTSFTYDAANRITRVVTADGGAVNYTYNTQNRVATATNGRGQVATYTYNAAGWPVSMTDPAGSISITYDANGNVLTLTDSVGTSTNTYDLANRLTSHTDVFGQVMAYGYDAVGNLTTLTYPGNKVVTYTYNAANRMTSVKDWANRLTSYTYNANGNITAITRANGTSGAYTYDAKGQLASLAETFPTASNNYTTSYTYDANGNITSEVNTPIRTAPTLVANTMTYGADNRLATLNGQAVTFDADGNMTSGRLNGAASTFTYDARSYLTGVGSSSYIYDAQGNRVSATNGGVTTRYVVDQNAALSRVLMETTATGTPVAYYVYGAAGLISRESAAGVYQTYHYDLRGSTMKLANVTGAVTDSYSYGPFGELVSSTGTTTNPFKYNGRDGVMTEANGLYYMRARYYLPEAKRFVNRDVLLGSVDRALTLNRFGYVNGNPVGFVDPSGMQDYLAVIQPETQRIQPVTQRIQPLSQVQPLIPTSSRVDIQAMLAFYDNHYTGRQSLGICATAIRQGLEAGGADTSGRPRYAADYHNFLISIGFYPVFFDLGPSQEGDITVYQAPLTRESPRLFGHIQVYDGQNWQSDFSQPKTFPGKSYQGTPSVIYRQPVQAIPLR